MIICTSCIYFLELYGENAYLSVRKKVTRTLSFLQALQLLNFLIVDCRDNLREAIGCLDPFPDTAKFKQINKCYKLIRKDRTSLREVLPVSTLKWTIAGRG